MKTNPNDPAQPHEGSGFPGTTGLTKREHFAAMAMQGYITAEHDRYHENIANDAVAMADALIQALNKQV